MGASSVGVYISECVDTWGQDIYAKLLVLAARPLPREHRGEGMSRPGAINTPYALLPHLQRLVGVPPALPSVYAELSGATS